MEVVKKHYLKSGVYDSDRLRIRGYDFMMTTSPTYVTDLDDYTILSNFDITRYVKLKLSEKVQDRSTRKLAVDKDLWRYRHCSQILKYQKTEVSSESAKRTSSRPRKSCQKTRCDTCTYK